MALLPGSAALGVGTAADYPGTTTPITTDQRGFRVDAPNPDIGAFQGVDLEVESTSGSVDTQPSSLTLPGAISLANNLERTTITFDPAVFATPETITLTGNPLELSNAGSITSIMGPAAGVTISGGGQSSVLEVERSVTASLSGLTITDGNSPFGGGVDINSGTVTLTDCTISGNSAQARRRVVQQRWYGGAHRLHDQRKLRGKRRRSEQRRGHGDTHRLHNQRKLRGKRRRWGIQRTWHDDAHRHDRRGQFRSERPRRHRRLKRGRRHRAHST